MIIGSDCIVVLMLDDDEKGPLKIKQRRREERRGEDY